MPNYALIPGSETRIEPLSVFVDGYPEGVHKLETITGGEPVEFSRGGRRAARDVTDHAVARPSRLVLTGWVSDFNGGERPAQAWAAIRELHKSAKTITVYTEWGRYEEMIIRRAEAPQRTRGMRFTLELEEIIRVGVVDANMPPGQLSGPASGRSGEVDRGRVSLPPAEALHP